MIQKVVVIEYFDVLVAATKNAKCKTVDGI